MSSQTSSSSFTSRGRRSRRSKQVDDVDHDDFSDNNALKDDVSVSSATSSWFGDEAMGGQQGDGYANTLYERNSNSSFSKRTTSKDEEDPIATSTDTVSSSSNDEGSETGSVSSSFRNKSLLPWGSNNNNGNRLIAVQEAPEEAGPPKYQAVPYRKLRIYLVVALGALLLGAFAFGQVRGGKRNPNKNASSPTDNTSTSPPTDTTAGGSPTTTTIPPPPPPDEPNPNIDRDNAVVWTCPNLDAGEANPSIMPHDIADVTSTTFTTLQVAPSPAGVLCHLVVDTPGVERRYLARSYNGHPWEAYSNFDSMAATNRHRHHHVEAIECDAVSDDNSNNGVVCFVALAFVPPPSMMMMNNGADVTERQPFPTSSTLSLQTTTTTTPLSDDSLRARFLEQATFGATRSDVQLLRTNQTQNNLPSPQFAMAAWMHHQIYQVPASSHREAYRRRLNDRFPATLASTTVTHPCRAGTWYRRATFAERDNNQGVEFSSVAGNNQIEVRVNGQLRTYVTGPITVENDDGDTPTTLQVDGTTRYEVCGTPVPLVGDRFRLRIAGSCEHVHFAGVVGNPIIQFLASTEQQPRLSLDGFVAPVNHLDGPTVNNPEGESGPPDFVYVETPLQENTCADLPILASWDSLVGDFPLVFGTYQGQAYIHDPRFAMRNNTPENPLFDGGGALAFDTTASALAKGEDYDPEVDIYVGCANVPMTFVNQDSCFLSREPLACEALSYSSDLEDVQQVPSNNAAVGTVVCTSPGEVANNPATLYDSHDMFTERYREVFVDRLRYQRKYAWTETVLWSEDQLRQRVAWALSQTFAITPRNLGVDRTERFVHFYDIFVRNAFGNFRNILREVAYSPVMANMLSYTNSRSTAREWRRTGTVIFPDENFAREVMQLFMVGLYELNEDGSVQRDENGPILTYTNNEIVEYSRVWTGFNRRGARGNTEDISSPENQIDPLLIRPEDRDPFPKMGLRGRYIGEGYPLCSDLPHGHFLKQGAEYRLLGGTSRAQLHTEPDSWINNPDRVVLHVNSTSGLDSLYDRLCAASNGACTHPAVVVLNENINCRGNECSHGSVNLVQLETGVFYEYIRPACVYQAFYANAQIIEQDQRRTGRRFYSCGDPRTEVASAVCCAEGERDGTPRALFWGEKVRFATAQERCNATSDTESNRFLCTANRISTTDSCGSSGKCDDRPFYWTGKSDCSLRAKIDHEGKVALVYVVDSEDEVRLVHYLRSDTPNFFRVQWNADKMEVLNIHETCERQDWCIRSDDGECICQVSVTEETAFDDIPTREEVLSLSFGAFDPEILPNNFVQSEQDGVIAYTEIDGQYTDTTIFKVTDDAGQHQFRKNFRSTVSLLGLAVSFRNPVHFLPLTDLDWNMRNAIQETEAALDQYFYHPNAAPFLAIRLAQRFGISNPTPRYVSTIGRAFTSGIYEYGEGSEMISFGTGSYGDLASTVAAVLLDRESRTPILDYDVVHGSLREPLLRVIGLMRSMEFVPKNEYPLPFFNNLETRIGQMAYEQPDVFSFFHPGFQPEGEIANLGLVSPESQLHVTPFIVDLMNGLVSMIKYGLNSCFGGFGRSPLDRKCSQERSENDGSYGYLAFESTTTNGADVVNELATLLTGGRLSHRNRQLIAEAYSLEQDPTLALIRAQQMIVATPEFHATGAVEGIEGKVLEEIPPPEASNKPYKAVVHLLLAGGCDSFNLVVPHGGCGDANVFGGDSLHEQYMKYRGLLAIPSSRRSRLIEVTGQQCTSFAINEDFPIIHDLFNSGDLSFFLNTGVLENPTNKSNFDSVTITQLFAHNTMRHESRRVDPRDESVRSGVLGRMASVLSNTYSYVTGLLSLNTYSVAVAGGPTSAAIVRETGPVPLLNGGANEFDLKEFIDRLNNVDQNRSSLFGQHWAARFSNAASQTEEFVSALENIESVTEVEDTSRSAQKFSLVSKWIQSREKRGVDRDLIYFDIDGFDDHELSLERLERSFSDLNLGLTYFVNELKALDLWDNVTVVVTSEFGRTLTPNSNNGTDHGWGGHYFVFGGSVKGGQMLGQYPDDLSPTGPLNVGRGRILPTLSWESMWTPILEWMGVMGEATSDADRDVILPNALTTNTTLFRHNQVFDKI